MALHQMNFSRTLDGSDPAPRLNRKSGLQKQPGDGIIVNHRVAALFAATAVHLEIAFPESSMSSLPQNINMNGVIALGFTTNGITSLELT